MKIEIITLPCKLYQENTDFYYALKIDDLIFRVPESQYPRDVNYYPDNTAMLLKLADIKDALELGVSFEHTML